MAAGPRAAARAADVRGLGPCARHVAAGGLARGLHRGRLRRGGGAPAAGRPGAAAPGRARRGAPVGAGGDGRRGALRQLCLLFARLVALLRRAADPRQPDARPRRPWPGAGLLRRGRARGTGPLHGHGGGDAADAQHAARRAGDIAGVPVPAPAWAPRGGAVRGDRRQRAAGGGPAPLRQPLRRDPRAGRRAAGGDEPLPGGGPGERRGGSRRARPRRGGGGGGGVGGVRPAAGSRTRPGGGDRADPAGGGGGAALARRSRVAQGRQGRVPAGRRRAASVASAINDAISSSARQETAAASGDWPLSCNPKTSTPSVCVPGP